MCKFTNIFEMLQCENLRIFLSLRFLREIKVADIGISKAAIKTAVSNKIIIES